MLFSRQKKIVVNVRYCPWSNVNSPSPQSDVELPIPRYFISENSKVLKERDKMLGTILAKIGPQDAAEVGPHKWCTV